MRSFLETVLFGQCLITGNIYVNIHKWIILKAYIISNLNVSSFTFNKIRCNNQNLDLFECKPIYIIELNAPI